VTLALTYVWPDGALLLWPVPIPDGRDIKAWRSARRAYELACDQWVQMVWDDAVKDYRVETAENLEGVEAAWPPENSLGEYLKCGFDGRVTDNEDHPYVRRLRGLLD
jgi:hypothetical protein